MFSNIFDALFVLNRDQRTSPWTRGADTPVTDQDDESLVVEPLACYSIRYFSMFFRFYATITFETDIPSQYQQELSNRSVMDKEKNHTIYTVYFNSEMLFI